MSDKGCKCGVRNMFDIAIIGGGPSGLTAGLYASRARMKVLLMESMSVMGQLTMTDEIENFPGVGSAKGYDLIAKMKEQAVSFGLDCRIGTVSALKHISVDGKDEFVIETEDGIQEKALSVIIASGARPRKLGVKGETEFTGKGVSYCATCDAAFFREKDIVVVGGGDTAIEEAIFLTKFGRKVTVIHRRDRLRAAKILQERAFANKKIEFEWESVVDEINGDDSVTSLSLKNIKTGGLKNFPCDGVFVFTGWTPNTDFADMNIEMDERGFIIVNASMNTSVEGIFAGGDCCDKPLKQVVTACGDGAVAAESARLYVEELKGVAY